MNSFLRKTFGGLSFSYYLRNFLFGLIIYISLIVGLTGGKFNAHNITFMLIATVLQFLYPYSRFVYESIMSYIFGNNVFVVNAVLMLSLKAFTMMMCWAFAWVIAPIGLIFLYFYHSKQEKEAMSSTQE